jgi:putative NADH-flavin reductase
MKIALFGATGGVGRRALDQALAQGHNVRALVRTPAKLTTDHENLTVIAGDVLDREAVDACVAGSDAVLCSLGTTGGDDPVEATGTAVIIASMKAHDVSRLVVITSLGVGDSKDQVPFFFKMLMKTALRQVMAAKEEQEKLVKASGLDWIIVRPAGLSDDPAAGQYTAGLDKSVQAGQVSRADVADFALKQLTDDTYLHETPFIT